MEQAHLVEAAEGDDRVGEAVAVPVGDQDQVEGHRVASVDLVGERLEETTVAVVAQEQDRRILRRQHDRIQVAVPVHVAGAHLARRPLGQDGPLGRAEATAADVLEDGGVEDVGDDQVRKIVTGQTGDAHGPG